MDRLSSCYFCGAALDASLTEYPVVPKRLQSDDATDQTVVLCPTCRRKLATVLKEVVTAVDPEDQSGAMDESGMEPQPDPDAVGDANETDAGLIDGVDEGESTDTDAEAADAVTEAESGSAPASEPESKSDPADEAHPIAEAGADDETADRAAETAANAADDDAGTGDDGPSLTRLEYNKVMRLLQNRQFPVDRNEIREVAINAYDLKPAEFDAVIEAAVERNLIGVEDGQFVAAE
ncbi:hypothetical protein [Haloarcula marina]|uniref:hypothetical protein n=1 Tax=Haloarcula marina TaxID=2961574 RepID=UPI0020B6A0DC|nr:hypothetical protein [Halomicroarcula marina]